MNYITLGAALFAALLAFPAEAACIKNKSRYYQHGYMSGCLQRFGRLGWGTADCWRWANNTCSTLSQASSAERPTRNRERWVR